MAASASGIRAGRAYVELLADDRALARGLRAAQQKLAAFGYAVRRIGTQMAALGIGIIVPLGLAAKSFADTGSQLNDMAARTGLNHLSGICRLMRRAETLSRFTPQISPNTASGSWPRKAS
jgi:hypothetical protein